MGPGIRPRGRPTGPKLLCLTPRMVPGMRPRGRPTGSKFYLVVVE